jgi:hypothetical protein
MLGSMQHAGARVWTRRTSLDVERRASASPSRQHDGESAEFPRRGAEQTNEQEERELARGLYLAGKITSSTAGRAAGRVEGGESKSESEDDAFATRCRRV